MEIDLTPTANSCSPGVHVCSSLLFAVMKGFEDFPPNHSIVHRTRIQVQSLKNVYVAIFQVHWSYNKLKSSIE